MFTELNLFTTWDVEIATGLKKPAVHAHIKKGTLKAIMVGHTYIIKPEDFRSFITRHVAGEFKPGWPRKEKEEAGRQP